MQPSRINWAPPKRHLRSIAWLVALGLAVFGVIYESTATGWNLRLAAAIIFAVGTVLPGLLRWPYVLLLILCYPLLWILTRLLPAPADPGPWKARSPRARARRRVRPA
ncbi:MAG TPA: hypothetical protein VKI17_00860 [Gemmataceae bacterium]|nr:hypothetical protein [Gemmataceae bacterium]